MYLDVFSVEIYSFFGDNFEPDEVEKFEKGKSLASTQTRICFQEENNRLRFGEPYLMDIVGVLLPYICLKCHYPSNTDYPEQYQYKFPSIRMHDMQELRCSAVLKH
jgi:hypothetical protein